MKPNLAIIGATGAVGARVCQLLEQRNFAFESIRFFGSPNGAKRQIQFRNEAHPVIPVSQAAVQGVDLAIASTPDEAALEIVPWIVEQGGVVVDESAAHRMRDDVPLVVPEVNPQAISNHNGIIASPNCTTIQLVACLFPLLQFAEIKRIVVATYQAASGAGEPARQDFIEATLRGFSGGSFDSEEFERPLANSLIPKIGRAQECGGTSEELKIERETRKILDRAHLAVSATCVRVPIENCHGESVNIEFEEEFPVQQARELFSSARGIVLMDEVDSCELPMPSNCCDRDEVFVGRLRRDHSVDHGLAFWCVSDNLRKGAATNAVQIAELLVG